VMLNLFGKKKEQIEKQVQEIIEPEIASPTPSVSKKNIRETSDFYHGKKSFITKQHETALEILGETGRMNEASKVIPQCVMFSMLGAVIGFLLNQNILLIAILGIGFFMIPFWRLKLYRNKYRKYLSAQLESSINLITISYCRNADIVKAVEENLEDLSPLIKPYFQEFVTESKVNPSLKNCVRTLRDKINDSVFHEWCETLIRTLDNVETREALIPIAQKYVEIRIVQDEIDIETRKAIMEYAIMMAMDVLAYPLIYFLNKDWFAYFGTIGGKVVIGITCIILLFSIAKLVDIAQPVQFER
ncbi:MAG: hypothetical protein KBS44_04210, partial [Clostridiales bacterium]|nr:hypothetical protein [Candidatus Coliplasma equi]